MQATIDGLREAALTLQQGGGIGYDFSTLRPKGAPVKGVGADASGPLSFMDVWDSMCRTIMSAGARRGVPDRVFYGWWIVAALAILTQVIGQGLMIYAMGHLPPMVIGLGLLLQPFIAAVIGSDGFGFAKHADGTHEKIPQVGRVVIESDVEIGAHSAVDRPAVGETRIKSGTKIDIDVDVGVAKGKATVWTCDLTHGYISINADYRS